MQRRHVVIAANLVPESKHFMDAVKNGEEIRKAVFNEVVSLQR
jgi:hypothetical protein